MRALFVRLRKLHRSPVQRRFGHVPVDKVMGIGRRGARAIGEMPFCRIDDEQGERIDVHNRTGTISVSSVECVKMFLYRIGVPAHLVEQHFRDRQPLLRIVRRLPRRSFLRIDYPHRTI
ncbi:hypothetical protein LH20_15555 [Sphingopyxis sp. 113P3]|nr:hypothetical protein LH20_15555 [Sphingopyxis sp. 113P3]